jgi:hypothetical protein
VSDVFVVRVQGNLVVSIGQSPRGAGDPALGTALEVGTRLATNFRETGRLDDDYLFADAEGARTFAALCLQFMKSLVEQRSEAISALPRGFTSYDVGPRASALDKADNRS